ncbi:hypothetical protein Goe25_02420 [Bacillus phage vB_BsuM-Goe25]|nr:hypothetical protein Goe25_02420 [Bacillus phage vB_BsuM-Goe25]
MIEDEINLAESHLHSLIHLVQLFKESKDNNNNSPQLLVELNKNLYDYYQSVGHPISLKGIEIRVSEVGFTIWAIKDADTGEVLAHSYF